MLIGIGTIYMITTVSAVFFPLMKEMDRKELVTE
jgi:hypothetical protein